MVSALVVDRRCCHKNEFRECVKNWLIHEQRQNQATVDACLLLLDENYVLTLPLPPRVILPESPRPRNFCFLFHRHVASLLDWTERRGEGEVHGFSDSVNKFIREVWWPDDVALSTGRDSKIGNPELLRWLSRSRTAHRCRRCSSSRKAQRRCFRGALPTFNARLSPSLLSHACNHATFRINYTHIRPNKLGSMELLSRTISRL